MLWDGARGEVRPARSKEGSHDYRYFPEPDLPPLVLSSEWIETQRSALPELPQARQDRLVTELGLARADVEVLTASRALADYFEGVVQLHGDPKAAANWVMGEVLAILNATGVPIAEFRVRPADLAQLLNMIRDGVVSHTAAKKVFASMAETGRRPEQVAKEQGLVQVGDDAALERWIDEVIAAHPGEWQRFQGGERKLIGVLVGGVMKRSKGSADPRKVNQLLLARVGG
jgi:aspartyl-tRNA(Asn)/glutamyl-tRNA(Gln) amidotransferase subunit B